MEDTEEGDNSDKVAVRIISSTYGSIEDSPTGGQEKVVLLLSRDREDVEFRRSFGYRSRYKAMHDDDQRRGSISSIRSSIRSIVDKSLSFGGSSCSVRDLGGTATIPNEIFNLIKNLVGCGCLSLPAGVAAFANAPSAMGPAAILILVNGAIFGYYFLLLGKVCRMTCTATYREAWEDTVGMNGSAIIALVNTVKPGLANLAYSMILADTFQSLFVTSGLHMFTRTSSLLLVTVVALLPLSLLKNLQVLAPFSVMGLAAMCFISGAMIWRYMDGTYGDDGKFVHDVRDGLEPSVGSIGAGGALTPNFLVLACMIFEAFVAHYNAPRFYAELKDPSIPRFRAVVVWSFGISSVVYTIIACFGFLTFGANADGNILNNYSTNDPLATMCRIALALAIIFTYPITFLGMRDGVLDLLTVPMERQTSWNLNVLTVILLILITVLALIFQDLGLVNSVGGGTLGTAVVFIFPALMYRSAVIDLGTKALGRQKREKVWALILMCIGIAMGVVGVWVAILQSR